MLGLLLLGLLLLRRWGLLLLLLLLELRLVLRWNWRHGRCIRHALGTRATREARVLILQRH